MNRKRAILLGIAALAGAALLYSFMGREEDGEDRYIMERGEVSLRDIRASMRKIDFNNGDLREYFGGSVVNPHTIDFFNSLQRRFPDFASLDDHFNQVRDYLYTVMSRQEADRLMELYRSYIRYQKNLAEDMRTWEMPSGPDGAVEFLRKVQEYRRNFFGKSTADTLFGATVAAKEYSIRRYSIVNDGDEYGSKKEERIRKLNSGMFGNEGDEVEASMSPFSRYQEKLQLYKKDLEELGAGEKAAKIAEFRAGIFTPEVAERFEKVDAQLEEEKRQEDAFRSGEEKILGDPNLSGGEKERKIQALQDDIFGGDAEYFRRREQFRKTVVPE